MFALKHAFSNIFTLFGKYVRPINRFFYMEKYDNASGKSTITHYEIGEEYIIIKYKHKIIEYCISNNSEEVIGRMKELAQNGAGLSRYISKHKVKEANANENKSIYQRLKAFF